ncbi:MAG: helix-turn-helix transcriptional regulator [Bacteroidetes bacterium]|nr:helix-turn-helix transcriptional regulator [Bacteroidota bacterium]
MKDRIIRFLSTENKTSAQFAEEIGVQPSGVSHILSGRNNPSLDFVVKMLKRYNYLSPEWLLFGREPMYRSNVTPTLFDDIADSVPGPQLPGLGTNAPRENASDDPGLMEIAGGSGEPAGSRDEQTLVRTAEKMVIFYTDRTFVEYVPVKK